MVAVPDEMLMAYADGELTPDETRALDNLLGQDPGLRARLEPFVETRTRLASAFEASLHEPIPDRLIAAITRAPLQAKPRAQQASGTFGIRQFLDAAAVALFPHGLSQTALASVAALLCAGAAAGYFAGRASAPQFALVESTRTDLGLVASGALAQALETTPSRTPTIDGTLGATIVPVLSFQSHGEGVCREYRIAHDMRPGSDPSGRDYAGVACRTADGHWRVALHTETPKQSAAPGGTAYQTATAQNVPAVDALVDSLITGDALGADDETKLLKRGWQAPDATRP